MGVQMFQIITAVAFSKAQLCSMRKRETRQQLGWRFFGMRISSSRLRRQGEHLHAGSQLLSLPCFELSVVSLGLANLELSTPNRSGRPRLGMLRKPSYSIAAGRITRVSFVAPHLNSWPQLRYSGNHTHVGHR